MSAGRVLVLYTAWMTALIAVNFAFVSQHVFLWTAIGLSSVAAIAVGILRNQPRRRTPWWLLAAAVLCLVAGDLASDVMVRWFHNPNPFPSFIDGFYLVMYLLLAVGFWTLYRRGAVRRDPSGLLDALILATGLALLSWIYLIDPYVRDSSLSIVEKSISVAYPLADILVLAVGVRFLVSARRIPSLLMLGGGLLGLLVSDVAYGAIQLGGHWHVGTPVDLGWALFYGLWGAAALHPSMRELTEPKVRQPTEANLIRSLLVGLALLIGPVVLLIEDATSQVSHIVMIGTLSIVLSVLVLTRLGRAMLVQRHSAQRELALRQSGAALLSVTDVDGVSDVVADTTLRLLPPGRPHQVVLEPALDDMHESAERPGDQVTEPVARDVAMVETHTLEPGLAHALGGFDLALRCSLNNRDGTPATSRSGALYIAADPVTLSTLYEAAAVLATQAALALGRIVLSREIDRRNSETYFQTLAFNAIDVIVVVDDDDRIRYASPAAANLFMGPDVVGLRLTDLIDPDSRPEVRRRLERVRDGYPDHHDKDWLVRRVGGRRGLVEATCRDLRDEPSVHSLVITLRDVTESRRLEAELRQRATYDSLTGLANRQVLLHVGQQAIEWACTDGATVAVIVVELNDFKMVNNTMGHEAGDELLQAVAQRLAAVVRGSPRPSRSDDTWMKHAVARLGGDEFAMLTWYEPGQQDPAASAEAVTATFQEPFSLSFGSVNAGASVGIATTNERIDAQELLRRADVAVYSAKQTGKGKWVRYQPSLHTAVVERLKLRSDLDEALAEEQFIVVYQPIVAIAPQATVGFEALVRWNHPTRGVLSPLDFIDIAEESGLIVPLGSWVLQQAVLAAVRWRLLRPERGIYVSVNVSAQQLRSGDFVQRVRDELARSGLPHGCLVLELTESIWLGDDEAIRDELNALRSDGLRIAIDDFGTGFSSLSYLEQLPVDLLKIDKSFVDSITSSGDQKAIVGAIVQLADGLGLGVIAEGIETHDELNLLISMGCEFGQGFLMSRPMGYADTLRWLVNENVAPGSDSVNGT